MNWLPMVKRELLTWFTLTPISGISSVLRQMHRAWTQRRTYFARWCKDNITVWERWSSTVHFRNPWAENSARSDLIKQLWFDGVNLSLPWQNYKRLFVNKLLWKSFFCEKVRHRKKHSRTYTNSGSPLYSRHPQWSGFFVPTEHRSIHSREEEW